MTSTSSSAASRSTDCRHSFLSSHAADLTPARFVLRKGGGRQIDFQPVDFDERGDGWHRLIDGTRGRYPAADLMGGGRIGGRQVRCENARFAACSKLPRLDSNQQPSG